MGFGERFTTGDTGLGAEANLDEGLGMAVREMVGAAAFDIGGTFTYNIPKGMLATHLTRVA